jgi:hypothetical protein
MQIPRSPTDTLNIDKDKYYESLSFGEWNKNTSNDEHFTMNGWNVVLCHW